jgi:transcriptional regulator with XRE-family HTH domain
MTIRELAEVAGVSTRTIVQVEAGQIVPRFATLKKIAAALDVEPREITEFAAAIEAVARGEEAA